MKTTRRDFSLDNVQSKTIDSKLQPTNTDIIEVNNPVLESTLQKSRYSSKPKNETSSTNKGQFKGRKWSTIGSHQNAIFNDMTKIF